MNFKIRKKPEETIRFYVSKIVWSNGNKRLIVKTSLDNKIYQTNKNLTIAAILEHQNTGVLISNLSNKEEVIESIINYMIDIFRWMMLHIAQGQVHYYTEFFFDKETVAEGRVLFYTTNRKTYFRGIKDTNLTKESLTTEEIQLFLQALERFPVFEE